MKLLQTYEVRQDIFDKILYDYSANVEITNSLDKYVYGYNNKKTIYYDGSEYLICREYILNYYTNNIEGCTEWKQVKLRRVLNKDTSCDKTVTGFYAYNYIMKMLKKVYRDDEIEEILNTHTAPYDKGLAQFKYNYPLGEGQLLAYNNCYKYDINGAHCDALVELFPRAASRFLSMYKKRKLHPNYKNIFNFAVGYLAHKEIYRGTYNWIVQRTTRKLYQAMDCVGGLLLYANTDGFLIYNPEETLETSKVLGDFKLEYQGTTYLYQSKNYWIMQNGDDIKGSCLTEARSLIDLRKGLVASYNKKRELIGFDKNNNPKYRFILENLKQEKILTWEQLQELGLARKQAK